MFWTVLAILIIVGWIFYSRRKGTVHLTKAQAEIVLELSRKEKIELKQKMEDMVDERALQGATVTVDSICTMTADMTEDVSQEAIRYKQELLYRYGTTIPVNTVHRISWELDGYGQMWSEHPGCFERHIQRREGNPLFPPERRIVTHKELEKAREADLIEQQQFKEKFNYFITKKIDVLSTGEVTDGKTTPEQALAILKELVELIEEGRAIGGDIEAIVDRMEGLEETLIKQLNQAMPEGAELIARLHNLSCIDRMPYWAQAHRKNSPILKVDEIPTILSEDLETISFVGKICRISTNPNASPNEAEIKEHLEKAIAQGFSKERASQIIVAWNRDKETTVN